MKLTLNDLTNIVKSVIKEQKEFDTIEKMVKMANKHNLKNEEVSNLMDIFNEKLGGYGVEVLRSSDFRKSYWGDIIALYVNMGETYETTILYDIDNEEFIKTSWGDFMENRENEDMGVDDMLEESLNNDDIDEKIQKLLTMLHRGKKDKDTYTDGLEALKEKYSEMWDEDIFNKLLKQLRKWMYDSEASKYLPEYIIDTYYEISELYNP
jgi:hypothetical protein